MSILKTTGHELLTPAQMGEADQLTFASGIDGMTLMEAAGHAVKDVILSRYPDLKRAVILCGPGNNGGDGYVVARLLAARGIPVTLFRNGAPRAGSDAAKAANLWSGECLPLANLAVAAGDVVVDALYGAGFKGRLEGADAAAAALVRESGAPVVAVDLPSGLSGLGGTADGEAFRANHSVTFFRKKPGHLLQPGRELCGTVHVANIGISPRVLATIGPALQENGPHIYQSALPHPSVTTHKYARGAVGVFSGEAHASGAARLCAASAAKAGAGAVTLLGPDEALTAMAAQVTSAMLRKAESLAEIDAIAADEKFRALVIGPGFGRYRFLHEAVLAVLAPPVKRGLVLDADVFSAFALEGDVLFSAIKAGAAHVVLTPHEGEFARLFPDLAQGGLPKHEKAREAAKRAGAVVILKGADSVIAAPDGRAAINSNGGPELATAGSGDVLAGIVGGLLAQGMLAFEAACAAVHLHAAAGARLGAGLAAEELANEIRLKA